MRALKYNSLSQLVTVIVGFTITILLLESEALLRWAQRLEVGEAANIAVQTTGELHRVLQPLHIEWARREGLADLDRLGWSDDPARRQAAQRMDASGASVHIQPCAAMAATAGLPVPGRSAVTLLHPARIPLSPSTPTSTLLPPLAAARRCSRRRLHDGRWAQRSQRSLVQIQPPQPIKSITYRNWSLSESPRYPPLGTTAIYWTVATHLFSGECCEFGPNTSPTT